MNAGAFGGELSQVVEMIRGVDRAARVVCLSAEQLGFGYRRTALPSDFIVAEIGFSAVPSGAGPARHGNAPGAGHDATPASRTALPTRARCSKIRPGAYAGRLIELAELKGARCGKARVSERHGQFHP